MRRTNCTTWRARSSPRPDRPPVGRPGGTYVPASGVPGGELTKVTRGYTGGRRIRKLRPGRFSENLHNWGSPGVLGVAGYRWASAINLIYRNIMVVARASGTLIPSSLEQNKFWTSLPRRRTRTPKHARTENIQTRTNTHTQRRWQSHRF